MLKKHGALVKTKHLLGLAVAGALATAATSATAADLGGDCCADLEERVAELEATTVRKGNRKVSLSLSGHVSSFVMFWDNGIDDDVYVVNNAPSETRFRLKGKAKISADWSAGYLIEMGVRGQPAAAAVTETDDDAGSGGPGVRKSEMWLKSKRLGKISWGLGSPALDDLAFYGHPTAGFYQPDWNWGNSFTVGTGLTVGSFTNGSGMFDESRRDRVRYDTPKIAGFVVSAAWGEDDYWDVALRYAGAHGDFKINGAVGYGDDDEGGLEETKASGNIWHKPSGIFVSGSYAIQEYDSGAPDSDGWHIVAGLNRKFNSLGSTIIFGNYGNIEDGAVGVAGITDSDADRWGVGVIQKIDAAALELVAFYSSYEFDASVNGVGVDTEDFDAFLVGGRIKF